MEFRASFGVAPPTGTRGAFHVLSGSFLAKPCRSDRRVARHHQASAHTGHFGDRRSLYRLLSILGDACPDMLVLLCAADFDRNQPQHIHRLHDCHRIADVGIHGRDRPWRHPVDCPRAVGGCTSVGLIATEKLALYYTATGFPAYVAGLLSTPNRAHKDNCTCRRCDLPRDILSSFRYCIAYL